MTVIRYDAAVIETFPLLVSGIVVGSHISNSATSPTLQAEYQAEQQRVIDRMGASSLGDVPALAAWHTAFRKFGVEPTKYRSASEALIRLLYSDSGCAAVWFVGASVVIDNRRDGSVTNRGLEL